MANGKIEKVKNKGGKQVGESGTFITKNGDEVEGILIGGKKKKSGFVEDISGNTDQANKKLFNELSEQDLPDRLKTIGKSGRSSTFRPSYFKELQKQGIELSENAKRMIAVHHVVPFSLGKIKSLKPFLEKAGYTIDDLQNAIGLPRVKLSELKEQIKALRSVNNTDELNALRKKLNLPDDISLDKIDDIIKELEEVEKFANAAGHSGSHGRYTEKMKIYLEDISGGFDKLSETDQLVIIKVFEKRILRIMENLEKGTSLENIF